MTEPEAVTVTLSEMQLKTIKDGLRQFTESETIIQNELEKLSTTVKLMSSAIGLPVPVPIKIRGISTAPKLPPRNRPVRDRSQANLEKTIVVGNTGNSGLKNVGPQKMQGTVSRPKN